MSEREFERPRCWEFLHDPERNRHWPCGKAAVVEVTIFDGGGFVKDVLRLCPEHLMNSRSRIELL